MEHRACGYDGPHPAPKFYRGTEFLHWSPDPIAHHSLKGYSRSPGRQRNQTPLDTHHLSTWKRWHFPQIHEQCRGGLKPSGILVQGPFSFWAKAIPSGHEPIVLEDCTWNIFQTRRSYFLYKYILVTVLIQALKYGSFYILQLQSA